MLPAILGLSGLALNDAERRLVLDVDPAGLSCSGETSGTGQLPALTDGLRGLSGEIEKLVEKLLGPA